MRTFHADEDYDVGIAGRARDLKVHVRRQRSHPQLHGPSTTIPGMNANMPPLPNITRPKRIQSLPHSSTPIALQSTMAPPILSSSPTTYSMQDTFDSPGSVYPAFLRDPIRSASSPLLQEPCLRKKKSEPSRLRLFNDAGSPFSKTRQAPKMPSPTNLRFQGRQRGVSDTVRQSNGEMKRSQYSPTYSPSQSRFYTTELPVPTSLIRDRGLSLSSHRTPLQHHTLSLRPSTSIPDYEAVGDVPPRIPNPSQSTYRPERGQSPRTSSYSNRRREPLSRHDGFNEDEVRTSFRSALTTNSSFFDTSGTERSSVVTKSSSVSDFHLDVTREAAAEDEGISVDEYIGMYENGFAEDQGMAGSRIGTAISHESESQHSYDTAEAMDGKLGDAKGTLRPVSPEIRSSTTFMSGEAFQRAQTLTSLSYAISTERDRYGFHKASQHVTLAQYDAWNNTYTLVLDRRKEKWTSLMKHHGLSTDNPTRFPPKSDKVKRYIRKGIPPNWRGAAWFWYAGGYTRLEQHPGLYHKLLERVGTEEMSENDKELIERDLNRTFPDNVKFKPDPTVTDEATGNAGRGITPGHRSITAETKILQALRRVLQTFSIHNPKIGYCQSLNFLAGLLLLFMEEEKAFWMLNIITHVYLPGTHEVNLEGANVDLGVLMISIRESMPAIWAKVGGELDGSAGDGGQLSIRLPPITLCTTAWFMSCFIGTLPIETVLRVWDSFFYEGSKTLFRVALAIFKVGEAQIRAVNDPMEIFQVVQTIPRRLIDAGAVMEACFKRRNGFGHLSQEKIEERRKQRRSLYAEERARIAGELEAQNDKHDDGLRHLFRRGDPKVRLKKMQLKR
ncbi:MAG: hypothetical protein M1827_005776 [Pycnora praestabilis]|nr:MAG: hypothetical protein M1827_005776 [Pycnora praestabilis]